MSYQRESGGVANSYLNGDWDRTPNMVSTGNAIMRWNIDLDRLYTYLPTAGASTMAKPGVNI